MKNYITICCCTLLIFTSCSIFQNKQTEIINEDTTAIVSYIIDGDTIILQNRDKIRLLGIDAPEYNEFFGQEAKDYLINLILNKEITLKKDKLSKDIDIYDRYLRYVYLDDENINLSLIQNGYASVYTRENFNLKQEFLDSETQAREKKLGIWQDRNDIVNINLSEINDYINEYVMVQLQVMSSYENNNIIFLNSKKDYKDTDNFQIVIFKNRINADIENLSQKLLNKEIEVMGKIEIYEDNLQIIVDKIWNLREKNVNNF